MAGSRAVKGSLHNDRGTWVVRGRVYDPNTGKIKQRSKTTGFKVKDNTKRKAQSAMKKIVAEWEQLANAEPAVQRNQYFSEFAQEWVESQSLSCRANTVSSNRGYLEGRILPVFGKLKMADITIKQIQGFCNDLLKTLSVASVRKYLNIIRGIFSVAVRDGCVQANLVDYIKLPKQQKFEGKAYTREQVAELLQAVEQEGEPIRAAITLAVCYGLRRSEICGLRWKDIDFENGELSIRNTIVKNGDSVIEEEHTKSEKSRRTIALIGGTIEYLHNLKEQQKIAGIELDKVCVHMDGHPVRPDYITRKSSQIMAKYGLEHIRLHDLRHTAATLLAEVATPKQVQDFLGHEDVSTTMNVYTHLSDVKRKETSGLMDGILENLGFCSEKCSESQ